MLISLISYNIPESEANSSVKEQYQGWLWSDRVYPTLSRKRPIQPSHHQNAVSTKDSR